MEEHRESERLLTVETVAERLDVTRETVRRWLRSGALPGILLARKAGWRVRESDLQRFLEQHMPQAANADRV